MHPQVYNPSLVHLMLIGLAVLIGCVLLLYVTGLIIDWLDQKQERERATRAAAERQDEIRAQTNVVGLGSGNVISLPVRPHNNARPAA